MHAYMIEKEIENRSMREWTEISMSSVYKLLNKLESEGLIRSEKKVSGKNVLQKVYRITPGGRGAFRKRIAVLLSEPEKMVYRIDLATSHIDQLPKSVASRCLGEYIGRLGEGIKCYGELERYLTSCDCPKHSLALARRPMRLMEAEMEWAKEYLKDIE